MPFQGHLASSGNIFGCQTKQDEGAFYWHLVGKFYILQGTGQPPTTKNYRIRSVNSTGVEKPCLSVYCFHNQNRKLGYFHFGRKNIM